MIFLRSITCPGFRIGNKPLVYALHYCFIGRLFRFTTTPLVIQDSLFQGIQLAVNSGLVVRFNLKESSKSNSSY